MDRAIPSDADTYGRPSRCLKRNLNFHESWGSVEDLLSGGMDMLSKVVTIGTAGLLVFPAFAHADDKAPAPTEKKICHKVLTTGSIRPLKTVCLTAAEWNRVDSEMSQIDAKGIDDIVGRRGGFGKQSDSVKVK